MGGVTHVQLRQRLNAPVFPTGNVSGPFTPEEARAFLDFMPESGEGIGEEEGINHVRHAYRYVRGVLPPPPVGYAECPACHEARKLRDRPTEMRDGKRYWICPCEAVVEFSK